MESTNLKLDMKNLRLIYELEEDSRVSFSKIAKQIEVSKEVANYRYKKLLETEYIRGFVPIIDYFALGYECYSVLINLFNLKKHTRSEIIKEFKYEGYLSINTFVQSDWDFELIFWAKTSEDFYQLFERFMEKYNSYIADKEILLIRKFHHLRHGYLLKKHNPIVIKTTKDLVKIDDVDLQVLSILEKDPKSELVKLSAENDISLNILKYRIKNLSTKNILRAVIPEIDVSLNGYSTYKIEIYLNEPTKRTQLIEYISKKNNVVKITEYIGRKDLDFEIDVKTLKELEKFLVNLTQNEPYIRDFKIIEMISE